MNSKLAVRAFRLTILLTSALSFVGTRAVCAQDLDFNRDIRPILSDKCFACHGPDADARQAELRLDTRDGLFWKRDTATAIVPGKPGQSEVIRRILASDPDQKMPPVDSNKSLTKQQIEKLVRWVKQGASWKRHWAFIPRKPVEPPKIALKNWPRNAIDHFILARQEQAGLKPSSQATPLALIRRLHLDLIGLPPTPEEADEWLGRLVKNGKLDDSIYEELVDQLLASKHYGERWARRWLDLARYADTNGYEKDRDRSIWPFRDWVIDALNADMPFDRFTIEQLAGDMLPNTTVQKRIATGFHRNTMLNEEGGIDPLEFRFHAMTDRVATTGTTWLGLTIGCAQCHSHKYDPISQREYYQFMAFLNNADEPDFDLPDKQVDKQHARDLKRAEMLLSKLAEKWPVDDIRWETPQPMTVKRQAKAMSKLEKDAVITFASAKDGIDAYTIQLETKSSQIDRLKLQVLPLKSTALGHAEDADFILSEVAISVTPIDSSKAPSKVRIAEATATAQQKKHPIEAAFDGLDETGWSILPKDRKAKKVQTAEFRFEKPVGFEGGTRLTVKLVQYAGKNRTLGRLRLSLGSKFDRPVAKRRAEAVDRAFASWLDRERNRTARWTRLRPSKLSSNLPHLAVQEDDSILASGDTAKVDVYDLVYPTTQENITAVRLEALPDTRLPAHGPGSTYYEGTKGDFFLGEIQLSVDGAPVKFSHATHNYAKNRYGNQDVSAAASIDNDARTGWSVHGRQGERHVAVYVLDEPIKAARQLHFKMIFGRHFASSLGRFRISVTSQPNGAIARDYLEETEELLLRPDDELDAAQRKHLRSEFLMQAAELAKHTKTIKELRKRPKYTTTLVMQERPEENPRPTFVHKRGEFLQPTEKVKPGTLSVLNQFSKDAPRNRLGFARWLVSPENPLTARVIVNRHWAAFFGRGIVETAEDFGFQGQPPSHPKLLDWLALNFVKQGWSLKRMHKTIVMSSTYRQTTVVNSASTAVDPGNRLLTRMPRFRLEAEIVRDATLKSAGVLSTKSGGPPVRPIQPAGVTEVAWGSPKWKASNGEDRFRRSVYTYMKRTAPFAMFNTFDAPSGESCIARRDVSNTALQALTLLNDVMFVEAARAMGRELSSRDGNDEDRATYAFRRVLTRRPTNDERARLVQFVHMQRQRLEKKELIAERISGSKSKNSIEHAIWTTLARALFSLDEAITRN